MAQTASTAPTGAQADVAHFAYPLWPPAPLIDPVHNYGRALDPLLLARPVWWKAAI